MITYPIRYNQDDECVEDSELHVIGHPFATVDEGKEVKHERGRDMAEGLNFMAARRAGIKLATTPEKLAETGFSEAFDLPAGVREALSLFQKKSLDRIERKHKKLVKKLIAKAAIEAVKGAA